jgi:glycosyltransferase involved in cell wall biosynthesis
MAPQLSVVIASINGRSYLADCLAALSQQSGKISAEVIVADCVGTVVTNFVAAEHPEVKLIPFSQFQTVATLRAAGMLVAEGTIIALTEDHCVPPSNWCESIWQAHLNYAGPAIGGAVDNGATDQNLDWAVFFCEYGNFISPVSHGVVDDLPGPNVSYKRLILSEIQDVIKQGYHETDVHRYLQSLGYSLWSDPKISMIHKKHFTLRGFLTERYHYSRAFAGRRIQSIDWIKRLFYLTFSPLLPPLLLFRASRRALKRKKYWREFCLSLPYLILFTIIWAVGEWVGYAIGSGDSERYLS